MPSCRKYTAHLCSVTGCRWTSRWRCNAVTDIRQKDWGGGGRRRGLARLSSVSVIIELQEDTRQAAGRVRPVASKTSDEHCT